MYDKILEADSQLLAQNKVYHKQSNKYDSIKFLTHN